jgi:hypothetical protein
LKGNYGTDKHRRRRATGGKFYRPGGSNSTRVGDGRGKVQPASKPAQDEGDGNLLWIVTGIGGGVAVVGIIFYLRASKKKDTTPNHVSPSHQGYYEWLEKENEKKDADKGKTLQGDVKEEEAANVPVEQNAMPVEEVDLASKAESEKTKHVDGKGTNSLRQAAEGESQEKAAMHLPTEHEATPATDAPVQQQAT